MQLISGSNSTLTANKDQWNRKYAILEAWCNVCQCKWKRNTLWQWCDQQNYGWVLYKKEGFYFVLQKLVALTARSTQLLAHCHTFEWFQFSKGLALATWPNKCISIQPNDFDGNKADLYLCLSNDIILFNLQALHKGNKLGVNSQSLLPNISNNNINILLKLKKRKQPRYPWWCRFPLGWI